MICDAWGRCSVRSAQFRKRLARETRRAKHWEMTRSWLPARSRPFDRRVAAATHCHLADRGEPFPRRTHVMPEHFVRVGRSPKNEMPGLMICFDVTPG